MDGTIRSKRHAAINAVEEVHRSALRAVRAAVEGTPPASEVDEDGFEEAPGFDTVPSLLQGRQGLSEDEQIERLNKAAAILGEVDAEAIAESVKAALLEDLNGTVPDAIDALNEAIGVAQNRKAEKEQASSDDEASEPDSAEVEQESSVSDPAED